VPKSSSAIFTPSALSSLSARSTNSAPRPRKTGGRRRGGDDYPLEEMERRYREKPVRAEIGIGGGAKARVYVDQTELPQGQVSRRAMFGIKLPF
jgi:hypothetical protein